MTKQKKYTTLDDFPMPDTFRAETQVIVDVVTNPDTMPDVMGIVKDECFSNELTLGAWKTLVEMYNAGETIDLFSARMKVGPEFTKTIFVSVHEPGTIQSTITHAKMLRDAAAKRKLYLSACWMLEKSTAPGGTEEDMVVAANRVADRFQTIQGKSEKSIGEVVSIVADDIQERARQAEQGKSLSITTGIPSLNKALYGGWEPGQLIILAARPSVGKTALMLQLARVAAQQGEPALIFSIEMTEAQLGRRLIVSLGEVTREEIAGGGTAPDFWDRFGRSADYIASLPITINAESTHVSDIVSKITIAVARSRCRIAFIDYLGLVKGGGDLKDMTNAQRIGEITKALKIAAKRCGIPIVLLCQLNREKDKGAKREPQLTDLRDSGDIEQDADVVLMLDQEDKVIGSETGAEERQIMVMWVRKMREGVRNFRIDLIPNESYTKFTEYIAQSF